MERDDRQHKRKSKGKSKKRSEKRKKTEEQQRERPPKNENDESEEEEQREARYQEYIQRIKDEYVPLHSELLDLTKWGFVDTFVLLCASPAESKDHLVEVGCKRSKHTTGAPLTYILQAGDGIYLMEIFTPEFCLLMLQEVDHFESWCAKQSISILRPNSMNNYGVPINQTGAMFTAWPDVD